MPKGICYEALTNLFCPEAQGDKCGGINEVGGKVVCRVRGELATRSWSDVVTICNSCDGRGRGSLKDLYEG